MIEARSLGKIFVRPSERNCLRILLTKDVNKTEIRLKGREATLVHAEVRFNMQAIEVGINTIKITA